MRSATGMNGGAYFQRTYTATHTTAAATIGATRHSRRLASRAPRRRAAAAIAANTRCSGRFSEDPPFEVYGNRGEDGGDGGNGDDSQRRNGDTETNGEDRACRPT